MGKIALGRGLEALIPTSASTSDAGTRELRHLSLDQIAPNPYQPRKAFDSEHLKELAESIKSRGLLQPIWLSGTAPVIYWLRVKDGSGRLAWPG